jgi:hypothetical protein
MNAFAVVSLQRIREFHLSPLNPSIPNHPSPALREPTSTQSGPSSETVIPC